MTGLTPSAEIVGAGNYDPTAPLRPSGNLRRRQLISRVLVLGAVVSAAIAVAALGIVTWDVFRRGASVLSFSFFTHTGSDLGGGGIAAELVGTGMLVLGATIVAVPVGVMIALYLSEFAGAQSRVSRWMKLVLDLLQGLPTIIVGVVFFSLFVNHRGDVGYAGSLALAVVMLPLIARSSQEVLQLVPGNLREAADALGVARWRSVLGVILPAAMSGIVTGAILAAARAAGETAPLLLTNNVINSNQTTINLFGHGVPNIPIGILIASEQASPQAIARAWGLAFALLGAILAVNIAARIGLARWQRRLGT